jgi:hypothetical protein
MNRTIRKAQFHRENGTAIRGQDLLAMPTTSLLKVFQEARRIHARNNDALAAMTCDERQSKAAQTMMHQRSVAALIFSESAVMIVERQLGMEGEP